MFNLTNEDTLPPEDLELLKRLGSKECRSIYVDILKLPNCDSWPEEQIADLTNQAVLRINFQETHDYVGVWVFMCVNEEEEKKPRKLSDDGTRLWPGKLSIMPLENSGISENARVLTFNVTKRTKRSCSLYNIIKLLRIKKLDVFDFVATDKYYHGGDRDYM